MSVSVDSTFEYYVDFDSKMGMEEFVVHQDQFLVNLQEMRTKNVTDRISLINPLHDYLNRNCS